jgi:3-oxoadipate enol-lactonase
MKKPVLHWTREGRGQLVVLSHALGCDLRMWDSVAALLKSRCTVLRYDHRGHGRSEAPPGPYSLDMLADDAAGLIGEQAAEPVHFVGLSLGGMAAQALATRHPALLKSITIANSASWYDAADRALWQARIDTVLARGVAAIADGAMQRWFTPEFRADEAGGGAGAWPPCGTAWKNQMPPLMPPVARRSQPLTFAPATAASDARRW